MTPLAAWLGACALAAALTRWSDQQGYALAHRMGEGGS